MFNKVYNKLNNQLFISDMKKSHSDASKGVKKTCAAHSFFQCLTTHPREIFFI